MLTGPTEVHPYPYLQLDPSMDVCVTVFQNFQDPRLLCSRYNRLRPSSSHVDKAEVVHEIRKTRGGALLDRNDHIKAVLDDNDFVSVGGYLITCCFRFNLSIVTQSSLFERRFCFAAILLDHVIHNYVTARTYTKVRHPASVITSNKLVKNYGVIYFNTCYYNGYNIHFHCQLI